MSDTLRSRALRLASSTPTGSPLRKKILAAIKQANPINVNQIKDGGRQTYSANGVFAHVWFDLGVAKSDFGHRIPDSGEWQVIITTSEDPLHIPRGQELARQEFRFADPHMRNSAADAAEDFILRALAKYRPR